MASTQTPNYSLPQWEKTDRIEMADFNSAMSAIDAALAAMPKIVTGSYVGTGTYGTKNQNSLTFERKPELVIIGNEYQMIARNGTTVAPVFWCSTSQEYYTCTNRVSWNNNVLSWYSSRGEEEQCNVEGTTYTYLAFLSND